MRLKLTTVPLSLLLSPIAVMVVIMGLGLFNLLIPKEWYEDLMGEHNYMVLNLPLALFVVLSSWRVKTRASIRFRCRTQREFFVCADISVCLILLPLATYAYPHLLLGLG